MNANRTHEPESVRHASAAPQRLEILPQIIAARHRIGAGIVTFYFYFIDFEIGIT